MRLKENFPELLSRIYALHMRMENIEKFFLSLVNGIVNAIHYVVFIMSIERMVLMMKIDSN